MISDKSVKGEGRGGGYQKSCYGITCVTESLLNSEEIMDICLLPSVLNHSTVDLHDCFRRAPNSCKQLKSMYFRTLMKLEKSCSRVTTWNHKLSKLTSTANRRTSWQDHAVVGSSCGKYWRSLRPSKLHPWHNIFDQTRDITSISNNRHVGHFGNVLAGERGELYR